MDSNLTMPQAITLIESLRDGDEVEVTQNGRTNTMFVKGRPTRSDGRSGDAESTGVMVTFGPGRYSTRIEAQHLVRTRCGRGYIGGGTTLAKR